MAEATWSEETRYHGISDIFVPVQSTDDLDEKQIHFLFAPKDEKIAETVRHMADLQREHDDKGMEAWAEKYPTRLWVVRDVEGLIQTGMRTSESTNEEVAKLQETLDKDFVVLDDAKPDLESGVSLYRSGVTIYLVLAALVGLWLAVWIGGLVARRRRRA